jgi:tripartite-type tricarboxylate transporter receptor subunit TctC
MIPKGESSRLKILEARMTVACVIAMGTADQPQVPVVRELPGLSNFNVSSWNALAAPAKTPTAIVQRINAEVVKVLTDPAMVQRLGGFNVQAQSSTPGQLAQLLDTEIQRWSAVIQKAGIAQQ